MKAGTQNWMFFDKSLVDFSGLTCNKIGVSYEGFYSESRACEKKPESCLHNQIEDFYQVSLLSYSSKFTKQNKEHTEMHSSFQRAIWRNALQD
jgi:hypothetical protein